MGFGWKEGEICFRTKILHVLGETLTELTHFEVVLDRIIKLACTVYLIGHDCTGFC